MEVLPTTTRSSSSSLPVQCGECRACHIFNSSDLFAGGVHVQLRVTEAGIWPVGLIVYCLGVLKKFKFWVHFLGVLKCDEYYSMLSGCFCHFGHPITKI